MIFSALFMFQSIAHEIAGCYMQNVDAGKLTNEQRGTKCCSTDTTYPTVWGGPNSVIHDSCSCADVQQNGQDAKIPPENLFASGCDIDDPDQRPCRKSTDDKGWEYRWVDKHWWGVLGDTLKTATDAFSGCMGLIAKVAHFIWTHGGAFLICLIVLAGLGFLIKHGQGFFGTKSSSGSDGPRIDYS